MAMSQCNASPQGPEKKILPFLSTKEIADEEFLKTFHTACLDTIFIQIYMDARPGVQGVSKEPKGPKVPHLGPFLR